MRTFYNASGHIRDIFDADVRLRLLEKLIFAGILSAP
jgi:hypothetical protein